METLQRIERGIDTLTGLAGKVAAVLTLAMVAVVFIDVILRYGFSGGSIAMQELEWHFFSAMFLLGISYAMREDSHVRVDIFYARFSPRNKALVDLGGALFFVLPFAALITLNSLEFVEYSYSINERSNDPGGLPYTWVVKALIPFSFALVFLSGIGLVARNLRILLPEIGRKGA